MTIETTEFNDPRDNPALHNAMVESVLADAPAEIPTIPDLPELFTRLPAGLMTDSGVAYEVEVQELNGAAEERLSKVQQSEEPGRWIQTLLECGVVSIGPHEATPALLNSLLVGDREYLVLAIRNATYGPTMEYGSILCEKCGEEYDLEVEISDIPVREMKGERQFDVPLRKGGKAVVRLPIGSDQQAYFESKSATDAERNSVLLSRCVISITDEFGNTQNTAGLSSVVTESLGIKDRQAILTAINDRQPGPRYDEVTFTHECGINTRIPVGLMHLFPGL